MPTRPKLFRPRSAPEKPFQYNNRRWLRVRGIKLARSPLCEDCWAEGRRTVATEVHHIQPINNGGPAYAVHNLKSLCKRCHAKQHAAVR